MNPQFFARYVRTRTKTNDTTFTDQELVDFMQATQEYIVNEAMKLDTDIFVMPQTADLVANQREYALPSDLLSRMERLEADFDDDGEYIKLKSMEQSEWDKGHDETTVTNHFSNEEGKAYFDVIRKSVYIYSGTISAVTDGLKLWAKTRPYVFDTTDLTSSVDMSQDPSTTELGMPQELHKVWSDMVVAEWKSSQGKPVPLTEKEQNVVYRLRKSLEALKNPNLDLEFKAKVPQGDDVWNDGFSL